MKRKDALTDLVEHVQETAPATPVSSSSGDRQVVNQQGETITLGQKPTESIVAPNKGVSLKLSEKQGSTEKTPSLAEEVLNRFLAKRKSK